MSKKVRTGSAAEAPATDVATASGAGDQRSACKRHREERRMREFLRAVWQVRGKCNPRELNIFGVGAVQQLGA